MEEKDILIRKERERKKLENDPIIQQILELRKKNKSYQEIAEIIAEKTQDGFMEISESLV